MIRSMEGFTFVSELDLNMGYHHIKLMLMLKSYVPLYSHGENTNTNTKAYPWVSRFTGS
jgi:hypothetical protein